MLTLSARSEEYKKLGSGRFNATTITSKLRQSSSSDYASPIRRNANMKQLTAILDEIFSAQPMAHWREVFDKARITYGLLRDPSDVIKDLQLRDFGTVVPLEVPAGTSSRRSADQCRCTS